jgi:hypothetical protein
MVTAKKTPAKKTPAKKVAAKQAPAKKAVKQAKEAPKANEPTFSMPQEVKDWIERANSMIQHLRGKVEQLEEENKNLKSYRKFAEQKILGASYE